MQVSRLLSDSRGEVLPLGKRLEPTDQQRVICIAHSHPREDQMHALIVMDQNGDSRQYFDAADFHLCDASPSPSFEELNEAGYIAAKRTGDGTSELIRQFDQTVHETLFIPRLVGG